ncbi:capsid [uncultured virus]|uniref:Capsid n=1 Tax=uncultured virus TaxID=340016 RepID=A0A2K9LS98_9VIRU|nr:capsid [uncultured virus]
MAKPDWLESISDHVLPINHSARFTIILKYSKNNVMARVVSRSSRKKPSRGYKRARAKTVTRRVRKRTRVFAPSIPRPTALYPQGKVMRHRYVDNVIVPTGPAAGLTTYYVFRSNSMYDPDRTGLGHQPLYRDEMAAHYMNYTVLKSFIRVSVPNESTTKTIWGLCADDGQLVPANPTECMENHKYKAVMKMDKRQFPLVLKGWFNAALWDKTSVSGFLADDVNRTPSGNNPGKERNFIIWNAPLASGETAPAIQVLVDIVYEVLWRDPGPTTQS